MAVTLTTEQALALLAVHKGDDDQITLKRIHLVSPSDMNKLIRMGMVTWGREGDTQLVVYALTDEGKTKLKELGIS